MKKIFLLLLLFSTIYGAHDKADVRIFGATGDGVTDDTDAINAAIVYANSNGFKTYLPGGTYICAALTVANKLELCGDGSKSIIEFKSGESGVLLECNQNIVYVHDLVLDGGVSSDQAGTASAGDRIGIHISAIPEGIRLENLQVIGFDSCGIALNGNGGSRVGAPVISGCNIYFNYEGVNTGYGLGEAGNWTGGEYLKISDCTMHRNRWGLRIASGNVAVNNCHVNDNGYGITFIDVTNNTHGSITGCTINHNTVYAVYTVGTCGNGEIITGCNSFEGDWYLSNCTGFNIQNNNFKGTGHTFTFTGGGLNHFSRNWFLTERPNYTHSSDLWIISDNIYGENNFDNIRGNYFKTTTNGDATTIFTLPTRTDQDYMIKVKLAGAQNDGTNEYYAVTFFAVSNVSGTVTEDSETDDFEDDNSAGGAADISGTVSGTDYLIQVTGVAAETWNWTLTVDITTTAH